MARKKAITVSIGGNVALTISREALTYNNLVYIGTANRAIEYEDGRRSRIAYIGMTTRGVHRVAQSAAHRAERLLLDRGITELRFYPVRPRPVQRMKTWEMLERDLLIMFKIQYGAVPRGNTQGKNLSCKNLSGRFTDKRLRSILRKYS